MEKSELKGRGIFNGVFPRKKVAETDLEAAVATVVAIAAAFFCGRVVLFGMMCVLGGAFVFGFVGTNRRFYGVWAAAFAGLLFSGTTELWRYTAVLVFAMICDMICRERGGASSLRKAFLCAFAVFVTGIFKYIAVERLDFVLFITAAETLIGFLCTAAFSEGRAALKKGDMLTGDKAMCLYFTLAAVATGFGFDIYGVNVFLVIGFFMIMYFSQTGGVSTGAAMGVFLGLFALCSDYGSMSIFAAFAVMGLFGGMFRFLGKIGVACAAVFMGAAMLFYVGGDLFTFETAIAFVVSSAMFLLIPSFVAIESAAVTADSGYDVFKDFSAKRMGAVSKAIGSLSDALDSVSAEVSGKERIDRIIDSTVSCVCSDCGLSAYCWGSEIENTYKGFYKFTGECGKNGAVTEKDIPPEISKNCVRMKTITDVTNRNLDFYRQDMVWEGRIKEYKGADRKRMDIIGQVLGELSKSIKNDYKPDKKLTAKIMAAVKDSVKNSVKLQAYSVNGISGVYAIGAGVDLSSVISAAAGRRYALTGSSSNGEEADIYTALPKYKATFSVAAKPKTGNAETGDSFGDVCTQKGISLILSDGMGTGESARSQSMKMVELAERFFKASLSGETIIKLMDTVFINDDELFATADILETDLYDGKAKFIKTGAAASFLLRDGRIKTIHSSSLPPGLFNSADVKATEIAIKDGDVIIMMTDGVTDALTNGQDEDEWIKTVFDELNSKDPRFIAESIIKAAERLRGLASDDMTVAVVRIWEPIQ